MPAEIRAAIEQRAGEAGLAAVKRAAAELSDAYRTGAQPPRVGTPERVAAYLVTRMPATYAAARAVLKETRRWLAGRPIASVLDIGAGSGAASLAALEEYPEARVTMVDRDRALLEAAREWLPRARLFGEDVTRALSVEPHDLVLLAYSAGEIGASCLAQLWQAARAALIVIEPGTPRGFGFVRDARSRLLAAGAHMVAPCPFAGACPMDHGNWCHFAARVERSSLHRRLKGGLLGYEDEKFSYVAVAREPAGLPASRIIGHGRNYTGRIDFPVCTPAGLKRQSILARDRDRFRAARHAEWGDPWDMMDGK